MNTLGRREKIMQHFELEWSPDAVDDLDEIWDSIAIDGDFDIADSFVEKLREEARTLCDNARKGRIGHYMKAFFDIVLRRKLF